MPHQRILRLTPILLVLAAGCGGDDKPADPAPAASNIPAALSAVFGDYDVTCNVQITKANGSTAIAAATSTSAVVEIRESQPGVIGLSEGETIPGLDSTELIYGAAYVQNPVHVFLGTATANQHGDFGIWSSVRIGLPPDPVELEYAGCGDGSSGRFSCSPTFFQHAETTDSVNLVYFAVQAEEFENGSVHFRGYLADDHRNEAAAANGFNILADNDILGRFVDSYLFDEGATFEFTVAANGISGTVSGQGRSLVGSEPDPARFEMLFAGTKK